MKRKSYKRTPEHRKLMSDIKKSQIIDESWKKNISLNHADVFGENNPNWKGGISSTECFCQNCNKSFFEKKCRIKDGRGKFCSKKCFYNWRSENIRGELTYNFSGKSNIQKIIRYSRAYKIWRESIFERDGYTCVLCGLSGGWNKKLQKKIILNADHIEPLGILIRKFGITNYDEAMECDQLWQLNNGRTLCEECHRETPTYLNCKMVKDIDEKK